MTEEPVYVKINRKVWNTYQFRTLSRDARELFFYLATCPHGNMLGLFVLRPGYALDDLQWGTDRKRFTESLGELLAKGLFKYDAENEVILDVEPIVKHPPINENVAKAGVKIVNSLPKTPLFQDLKLLVESLGKSFMKSLVERLGERFAKSVTETVTETVTELKEDDQPTPPFTDEDVPFPPSAAFLMPTKEEIQEASDPRINELINQACEKLYTEKIFPEVHAFKNAMVKKKKNPRSVLHTLCRAYLKRQFDKEGPWAYCQKIMTIEDGNYNERDYRKTAQ